MSETEQIPKEELQAFFKHVKEQPENNTCFDCLSRQPAWASATFGVLICYDCSAHHRSMGVHISFVRSTSMDNWNIGHLRNVKVGGNGNARAFFREKRGAALLQPGTDFKLKYESKVAQQYLKELARKSALDAAEHPGREVIDLEVESKPAASKSKDDVFDQLAKETPATPAAPAAPAPSATAASTPSAPAAKLTVTAGGSDSKPKPGSLLGKARARPPRRRREVDVDFDAIEKEAKEETERTKALGYNPNEPAAKPQPSLKLGSSTNLSSAPSLDAAPANPVSSPPEKQFRKFGFGQTAMNAPAQTTTTAKPVVNYDAKNSEIAKKFGDAKAISSDDVFGRTDALAAADKQRLQSYSNATSISSSSYFGREEETPVQNGDFMQQAMEMANKAGLAMENMDMDDVQTLLENGANKLGDFLRSHLR